MESPVVLILILATITLATAPAYSQKIYGPENPLPVGSNVTLFSHTNVTVGAWLFNGDIIVFILPGNPIIVQSWNNRVTFNSTTSSLTIRSLRLEDSGMYTLQASHSFRAQLTLSVQAPVTMALINTGGAQPIMNHIFSLTCETTGTVQSIIWMNGVSQLHADNTRILSRDNATLTFDPLMQSDNGHYWCVASNLWSNSTSEIFTLDVFYGPEMPTVMGPNLAKTGDIVTFSCNASSNPVSFYKWFFNGSVVADMSKYVTPPLTIASSGIYICLAFNNITGKISIAYRMLTVVDQIIDVQVETSVNLAIEAQFYMLKCNVTGPAEHVYWMKNGEPLHEDNRIVFNMMNQTVTFNPLEHTDNGHYKCIAIYAFWNMTSRPYELIVNSHASAPHILSQGGLMWMGLFALSVSALFN